MKKGILTKPVIF